MKYPFLFLLIFLFACNHLQKHFVAEANIASRKTVNATDTSLQFKNGYWYYHDVLFSGVIVEHFNDKTLHQTTQYINGKEDGCQLIFYPDKILSEKRFYRKGEKDSVNMGWWQNGNKRFEYHFKNGTYNGDFLEWYKSGQLLKHIHYTNGVDDWGKGWRQNRKLYMNFVMKNGRRYGLNNSNLCYTVKNGNGEFINSVADNK